MMTTNRLRFSLAAAALLVGVATSPCARAADTDDHTVVVSYADLNLTKKAGVDALRRRLLVASRKVCGESSGEVDLTSDYESCQVSAMQHAMRDLRVAVAAANTSSYAVASVTPN